ncbi:MAG: hypothetical protein PHO32_05040 [Candidatus Cloacimonetes bacterium]|nr:hypothetical protein [Candidatus Cloacimonadota bacterium]
MKTPKFSLIKERILHIKKKKLIMFGSIGLAGLLGTSAALFTLIRKRKSSPKPAMDDSFMQHVFPDYTWEGIVYKNGCKDFVMQIPCPDGFLEKHPEAFHLVRDRILETMPDLQGKRVTIVFKNEANLLVFIVRKPK